MSSIVNWLWASLRGASRVNNWPYFGLILYAPFRFLNLTLCYSFMPTIPRCFSLWNTAISVGYVILLIASLQLRTGCLDLLMLSEDKSEIPFFLCVIRFPGTDSLLLGPLASNDKSSCKNHNQWSLIPVWTFLPKIAKARHILSCQRCWIND